MGKRGYAILKATINGNNVRITLTAEDNNIVYTMPDGYSYETLLVTGSLNINYFNPLCKSNQGVTYHFPPVRSKSPTTLKFLKLNATAEASLAITIVKFGQIPDPHYFDKAFEPILVTGNDGKEYKVIPSDQFK